MARTKTTITYELPIGVWDLMLQFMNNDEQLIDMKRRNSRQHETLTRIRSIHTLMVDENIQNTTTLHNYEQMLMDKTDHIHELEGYITDYQVRENALKRRIRELEMEMAFYKRNPIKRRLVYNVDEDRTEYE